jgi:hypothetical protein
MSHIGGVARTAPRKAAIMGFSSDISFFSDRIDALATGQ